MVAEKVLGNIRKQPVEKTQVPVFFEWFELEKKRIAKTAEDGTKLGVCIDSRLADGDILAETETACYVVTVLPSRLIKIHVDTMQQMGRLGFELGNRHLSLKIAEHEVWVPYDLPTFLYLKKLGFAAEDVQETFTDFIECRAHGHSHGQETHEHNHKHTEAVQDLEKDSSHLHGGIQ